MYIGRIPGPHQANAQNIIYIQIRNNVNKRSKAGCATTSGHDQPDKALRTGTTRLMLLIQYNMLLAKSSYFFAITCRFFKTVHSFLEKRYRLRY